MSLVEIGKFISLILRHKPEVIGITLDEHGWADVDELIEGIKKSRRFDRELLEQVVANDDKQRFSFNEDKTKIRANQGHSINVDVQLKQEIPPEYLYHGTAEKYIDSIMKSGLIAKTRLYVHLSWDKSTAIKVGSRHGKPVVIRIQARKMSDDGYLFYLSQNQVWLTKVVPVRYLEIIEQ